MPIYEFVCSSCGHKKEILIRKKSDMERSHKLSCDKCKGMYERVMSAPNFKVEGFNADNNYSHAKNRKGKSDEGNGKVP
jgi:putative FmdB family regulatory protein